MARRQVHLIKMVYLIVAIRQISVDKELKCQDVLEFHKTTRGATSSTLPSTKKV